MSKANLSAAIILLLSTLGMAALPHAIFYEAPHHHPDLMMAALPYVVGLVAGLLAWLAIRQFRNGIGKVSHWVWLAISFAVMLPPLLAQGTYYGRHEYPFEVDPTLVGPPFFAAWAASLGRRMGKDAPPMAWLCVLGGVGLLVGGTWLAAILIPSVHILLFPLLLLLSANATLRRIGIVGAGGAALSMLFMLLSSEFRLERLLNSWVFPYANMWRDPYGIGYQSTHIWMILNDLTWFGSDKVIHLPEATRQLLPVTIANGYGGLAFASLFLLVAFWFYLTRPRSTISSTLDRVGDMVWWALLYLAIVNAAGNLLIVGAIGGGMPMLSSNPAMIALALLVVAIRAQSLSADGDQQRRPLIAATAWTGLLALAVAALFQASADIGNLPITKRQQSLFSPATAKTVRDMLADTVSETGTAPKAGVTGIQVAGKTGSIVTPLDDRTHRHTALFVSIAPLDHPKYEIAGELNTTEGNQ